MYFKIVCHISYAYIYIYTYSTAGWISIDGVADDMPPDCQVHAPLQSAAIGFAPRKCLAEKKHEDTS